MSESSDPPNSGPYPGANDPWSTPGASPAPDPGTAPGAGNAYPTPPYPTPGASNPWGQPPPPQTPDSAGAAAPWQSQPVPPQPPLPGQPNPWGQPDPTGQPGAQPAAPYAYPYGVPTQPGQTDQPPAPFGGAGVPYPYAQPAAPSQPFTGQPFTGQPFTGQPFTGQPFTGQPFTGQPGTPYPYGAPVAPSQPLYGQPMDPSQQPYYGQPAAPSQPFYGQPGMPNTMPPQAWGPVSQTLPGAPPAAPRKSHRTLWIVLSSVVVLLLLLGGGGAFAFTQYFAPAAATGVFCGYLRAQDYSAAYQHLTTNLRGQFPQDQFIQGAQTLDKLEGNVTSCATASGSSYNYSFGSNTASVTAVIKRSNAGSLQGVIRLKNENGWKVDGLDTNLLGINLGALAAASAFCSDLQAQNYASAYALLGSGQTGNVTQQLFTQSGQLHDQIDGNITTCALNSLASGNDDTKANLGVTVTRSKLGPRQGTVNLEVEDNAWKIDIFDQALLGSDLQPLAVGAQFCTALTKGDYTGAYALFSADFKANVSQSDFTSILTPPSPLVWGGCTPDLTTYKVSGSTGSYVASLKLSDSSSGASTSINFKLEFVDEGGNWAISDLAQP